LQETKTRLEESGAWHRKLVTLNEANEVARRLAAMKSGSPVYDEEEMSETSDEDDDSSYADEVATYMSQAKRSL
jgi:hypothetical protein